MVANRLRIQSFFVFYIVLIVINGMDVYEHVRIGIILFRKTNEHVTSPTATEGKRKPLSMVIVSTGGF